MSAIKSEDIHEDEQIMYIIQNNIKELFSDISFDYYNDGITCSFHVPVLTLIVEDKEDRYIPDGKRRTKKLNVVIEVCFYSENLKLNISHRLYLYSVDDPQYIEFENLFDLKYSNLSALVDSIIKDYNVGKLISKEVTSETFLFNEPNIDEPNDYKLLNGISNKLIKKTQHELSKILNVSFGEFQDVEVEKQSNPVDAYFDILHCYRLSV